MVAEPERTLSPSVFVPYNTHLAAVHLKQTAILTYLLNVFEFSLADIDRVSQFVTINPAACYYLLFLKHELIKEPLV